MSAAFDAWWVFCGSLSLCCCFFTSLLHSELGQAQSFKIFKKYSLLRWKKFPVISRCRNQEVFSMTNNHWALWASNRMRQDVLHEKSLLISLQTGIFYRDGFAVDYAHRHYKPMLCMGFWFLERATGELTPAAV